MREKGQKKLPDLPSERPDRVVVSGDVQQSETSRFWTNNRISPVRDGTPYLFASRESAWMDRTLVHLFFFSPFLISL